MVATRGFLRHTQVECIDRLRPGVRPSPPPRFIIHRYGNCSQVESRIALRGNHCFSIEKQQISSNVGSIQRNAFGLIAIWRFHLSVLVVAVIQGLNSNDETVDEITVYESLHVRYVSVATKNQKSTLILPLLSKPSMPRANVAIFDYKIQRFQ